MTEIARAEEGEYPPFAKAYVDCVPPGDVIQILSEQIEKTVALLEPIGDPTALLAYAPGKWSVKQSIGHIIDAERIFSYRALRIARGDATPLPGFEQNDYIPTAKANERPLADLLDEMSIVRQSTLALVRSLPVEAWLRRGTIRDFSVTVRGIVFTMAGHELHHYQIFKERYLPVLAASA